jgi:hypothetical protein
MWHPALPNIQYDGISLKIERGTLRTAVQEGKPVSPKKTYPYNGKMVPGDAITVESANEPWAQFSLEDGTQVKAKLVLLDVVRLEGEYNDASGDPVYLMQFQQIIGVVAPEALKRKVQ